MARARKWKPSKEEVALVAAAAADPVARRAYADWLDERDRPVEAAEQRAYAGASRVTYRLVHRPTGTLFGKECQSVMSLKQSHDTSSDGDVLWRMWTVDRRVPAELEPYVAAGSDRNWYVTLRFPAAEVGVAVCEWVPHAAGVVPVVGLVDGRYRVGRKSAGVYQDAAFPAPDPTVPLPPADDDDDPDERMSEDGDD